MNKKESSGGFGEFVSRLFDIPADLTGDPLTLEMRGRRHLLVCGCRGILEYSPTCIRLALGHGEIRVDGAGLQMTAYYRGQTGIDGSICAVTFPQGERKC